MRLQEVEAAPAAGLTARPRLSRFAMFAWGALFYTLAVVAWGAFVRATGSGAGCGNHWPLCNGVAIPQSPSWHTVVEFSHRLTAALSTFAVVGLVFGSFRWLPRRHPARWSAVAALLFTILEAGIGAGLVLYQKVAQDQSFGRVVYLSVHLINTFLLVGAIALTAWWASGAPRPNVREAGNWRWLVLGGLAALLLLGMSGAVTALGETLYPSQSLAEGFRNDFAPTASLLIRLRIYHPLIAMLVGGFWAVLAGVAMERRAGVRVKPLAVSLIALVAGQWALGALDVVLLAPVWMQLVHLWLADVLWVAAVLLSADVLSRDSRMG